MRSISRPMALALAAVVCVTAQGAADGVAEPPTSGASAAAGFAMTVADRFKISGGGLVLTGIVDAGSVAVGDSVCLRAASGVQPLEVTGIESFNKLLDSASAGDRVGLLVSGTEHDQVSAGDLLTASCD